MRCPHCAGQIQEASRFCGICGGRVDRAEVAAASTAPPASVSLFELPASTGARTARLAFILVLDLILLGAGAAMIFAYFDKRSDAGQVRAVAPAAVSEASLEIPLPTPMPTVTDTVSGQAARTQARAARGPRKSSRKSARSSQNTTPLEKTSNDPDPGPETLPPVAVVASAAAAVPKDDGVIPSDGASGDTAAADPDGLVMEKLTRQVARVVNSSEKRAMLQRCYRHVAKASGPVQGKVVIRFSLMPNGRVTDVSSKSSTPGSDTLASCVESLFESWTFPAHAGDKPLTFLWPLVFKAPK